MSYTVRIPQLGATGPAGNLLIEKTNVAPGAEDGAIGDMAVRFDDDGNVFLYPKKTPSGWPAGRSIQGPQGTAGWSPIIATVVGPSSAILRLIDWVGGAGDKPAGAGKYIGGAGLVDAPESAAPFGFSGLAKNILYDAAGSGLAASNVQEAIDLFAAIINDLPWYAIPPGGFYYADTSIAGAAVPPQSHPDFVYVELTAGLTGAGQYNEGKLKSESVSGAAPLTVATAVVDIAGSPLYGETIHLINTEEAILRPRASGVGSLQQDQMQQTTGGFSGGQELFTNPSGAFGTTSSGAPSQRPNNGTGSVNAITFDSANSPGARAGSETRMKNIGVIALMRVK